MVTRTTALAVTIRYSVATLITDLLLYSNSFTGGRI